MFFAGHVHCLIVPDYASRNCNWHKVFIAYLSMSSFIFFLYYTDIPKSSLTLQAIQTCYLERITELNQFLSRLKF